MMDRHPITDRIMDGRAPGLAVVVAAVFAEILSDAADAKFSLLDAGQVLADLVEIAGLLDKEDPEEFRQMCKSAGESLARFVDTTAPNVGRLTADEIDAMSEDTDG